MAGAVLLGLMHPGKVGLAGERGQHLFAAMAVDDVDLLGMQRARGVEHMREHRSAGKRQQHLGARGLHAFALARGEDDDMQRMGRIHRCSLAEGTR